MVYQSDRLLFFNMLISFGNSETLLTIQLHIRLYMAINQGRARYKFTLVKFLFYKFTTFSLAI